MNDSRIIPESSGPYARALTTRRQETGDRNEDSVASPKPVRATTQCDQEQIDDLRAQLAATQIKLAAARLALAACREVREARES